MFFDVDGTLVRWPGEYGPIVREAVERTVGTAEEAWIDRYNDRFYHHFGTFVADPYCRAFADVCTAFDLDADPAELAENLIHCEFAAVEPVPGVADAVAKLADRHTLGILTNGIPEVQFGKVERQGLLERFDVRVASHDPAIAATKPDAAIYEAARERARGAAGGDPGTLVMVGDDYEPDIAGARAHGFEAVHVDAAAEGPTVPDFETLATLL